MKAALFAFNGDIVCFGHVLLNALDMKERGHEVTIIIEGSATGLIKQYFENPQETPFSSLYFQARDAGLIGCACKTCATKMGSKEMAEKQDIALCDEMSGHPSVARFLEEGYQVYTF